MESLVTSIKNCFILFLLFTLSACSSFYIDNGTPEVDPSKYSIPATKKPVQLIFEFQTKGAPNARATKYLLEPVTQQIEESSLFSNVSRDSVEGGAILSIVLNNVPVSGSEDAAAKGFVTGLTFGLVGSQVSDGYLCKLTYLSGNNLSPIKASSQHAIHTTLGAKGGPANGIKADNLNAAVLTMTRQIISQVLNELSNNNRFN